METLFRIWAPVWGIQFNGDYDRIGAPIWTVNGVLKVDTGQPLTYTLLSLTRFGKEILTQLNYIIWFPSRPKEGALDIYGGFLDGLNYRVTLDNNGEAILYETIHNCGCYYKAYPTNRLQVLEKIDYAEPPLILKAPDINPSKNFMTVVMESRTHFVQHLYPSIRESQAARTVYSLVDYDQFRSLPYSRDHRKSMFDQNSIVPKSKGWNDLSSRSRAFFLREPCASGAVMQLPSWEGATLTTRFLWTECLKKLIPNEVTRC